MLLVDHARPERLGELVRALIPIAPELEVHTEVQRMAEAAPGSTLVLVPREEDADWLNLNRPLFASLRLRVVLFCSRDVSVALARGAVDFIDWMSLRVDCPAGPAPFAVEGIRAALAARVPGIIWKGGDLDSAFAAARPRRKLRRVSAALPYEELVAEAKAHRGEWLAWTGVDGKSRLLRLQWALAEARRRTNIILVEPRVTSPGWVLLHGQLEALAEARRHLARLGAPCPGRWAALCDLEPEALTWVGTLLQHGLATERVETALLERGADRDALGRLMLENGLFEMQGQEREGSLALGTASEEKLRQGPRTGTEWEQLSSMALQTNVLDVAQIWAHRAMRADPECWQGLVRVSLNQGSFDEAETILRHQLSKAELENAGRAWALTELSHIQRERGRYSEAEDGLRQALGITEGLTSSNPLAHLSTQRALALLYLHTDRYAQATELLTHFLERIRELFGPNSISYGGALQVLGLALRKQGRYAEAESVLRESISIAEEHDGHLPAYYAASLYNLAATQRSQGKYSDADSSMRQSLTLIEPESNVIPRREHGAVLQELVLLLLRQGRYEEAEQKARAALSILEQTVGKESRDYAASLQVLAITQRQQGQPHEAEKSLHQALSLFAKSVGENHSDYAMTLQELGANLVEQGQYARAQEVLSKALVLLKESPGIHYPGYAITLSQFAASFSSQARYAEAEQAFREVLSLQEQTLGIDHPDLCATLTNLGITLMLAQRPQEGEPFLVRALTIAQKRLGMEHPEAGRLLSALAQTQAQLGKPEARETAQRALDILTRTLSPDHPDTASVRPILLHIIG
nr:tetratricopeptide repeat protein [Archangium primigenium]